MKIVYQKSACRRRVRNRILPSYAFLPSTLFQKKSSTTQITVWLSQMSEPNKYLILRRSWLFSRMFGSECGLGGCLSSRLDSSSSSTSSLLLADGRCSLTSERWRRLGTCFWHSSWNVCRLRIFASSKSAASYDPILRRTNWLQRGNEWQISNLITEHVKMGMREIHGRIHQNAATPVEGFWTE